MSERRHDDLRTRRSFLDLLLGTTVLGSLASIFYPVIRYLTPLPTAGPAGLTVLSKEQVAALDQRRFLIVAVTSARVLLLRDRDGTLRAFDARCTHEGCTVQYVDSEAVIWCACHNARFDLEGRVLSGPPPRPLPRYLVKETEDGEIAVGAQTS